MSDPGSGRDPVEELAEEFAARYRRGEHPSLSEYTDKYPQLAEQILEVFPALVVMEQFGSVAGPPTGPFEPRVGDSSALPEQLGDYLILREVGRGGMGVVYEAVQESLGRHVALKILPRFHRLMDPTHLERFRREARAAAQLHHTNIVPVFGVGEAEGIHYYAMQFIQGQGLDVVLEEVRRLRSRKRGTAAEGQERARDLSISIAKGLLTGRFREAPAPEEAAVNHIALTKPAVPVRPPCSGPSSSGSAETGRADGQSELASQTDWQYCRSVAKLGMQVADALAYAHKQRVLHRDIKPSNLLLDTQGTVWITDFGLAKADGSDDLTSPGDIVGTVRFMAPERFQGKADPRSDVYSLGLTLYEMLTLRPAFADSDRARLIERVLHEDPPRLRELALHVPRDLETIVLKAIAKEPVHRYPTAESLAEDLRRFLEGEPIRARTVGKLERFWRWCHRNPVVAGLIAAAALFLLAGSGISSYFAIQSHQRAEDALREKDRADDSAKAARSNLYAAQMKVAEAAWENGHVARVRGLLDLYRNPQPGEGDVRGWEWYYQERLCHDDLRTLKTISNSTFSQASVRWNEVKPWWNATGLVVGNRQPDVLQRYAVQSLDLSPDGTRMTLTAYPCWNVGMYGNAVDLGRVALWEVRSGETLGTLKGQVDFVSRAFSPDGKRLGTVGRNGEVTSRDASRDRRLMKRIPSYARPRLYSEH
jgi:serine/threonine protein kinase